MLVGLLGELGDLPEPYDDDAYEIQMSPHHHHHHGPVRHDASYPVYFPISLLGKYLKDEAEVNEAIEFMIEGPHHEVMANIVFQQLFEAISRKIHCVLTQWNENGATSEAAPSQC